MDPKVDQDRDAEPAPLERARPKLTLSKETVMNLTIRSNIRAGLRPTTKASGSNLCCG